MNCFKKNTVFPSVSSNFLEFRMFWHVPFQELQVSKRNRHFEQNFQLSQHLFPVPFFLLRSGCPWRIVLLRLPWRLWASLLECGHPWDAWQHPNNIQTTSTSNIQTPKKTPPTVKSNYFRVACQSNVFSFYSGNLGISIIEIWVLAYLSAADQFNAVCFRDFDEVSPMDFRSTKAQEWDDSIPKMACSTMNHMVISVISHSWAIPMFGGPIIPPSFYMGWIPIWFGEFQVLMGENQKLNSSTQFLVGCIILYSLCPNLMVLLLLFANSIVYITTC